MVPAAVFLSLLLPGACVCMISGDLCRLWVRSLDLSLALSRDRAIAWFLDFSLALSRDRSLARSLDLSLDLACLLFSRRSHDSSLARFVGLSGLTSRLLSLLSATSIGLYKDPM
jgi:hypothetical protein